MTTTSAPAAALQPSQSVQSSTCVVCVNSHSRRGDSDVCVCVYKNSSYVSVVCATSHVWFGEVWFEMDLLRSVFVLGCEALFGVPPTSQLNVCVCVTCNV